MEQTWLWGYNMMISSLPRYDVKIAIGTRKRYSEEIHTGEYVHQLCQQFVNFQKTCITLTNTNFIYVNGNEPGFFIGLINYPRFPKSDVEVYLQAETLAYHLMDKLDQERCSIITPTDIYLYENPKYRDEP